MLYHLSAAWLLLAAAVAVAVEVYDEVPPAELENEMIFQEDNDIESAPRHRTPVDESEAARLQDLLLFRLLKSQLRDEMREERREHNDPKYLEMTAVNNSLSKRIAQSDRGARPQQRWKTKKGRGVGPQMVCYFKLCAFRNPV